MNNNEAKQAMLALDKKEVDGQNIKVNEAIPAKHPDVSRTVAGEIDECFKNVSGGPKIVISEVSCPRFFTSPTKLSSRAVHNILTH